MTGRLRAIISSVDAPGRSDQDNAETGAHSTSPQTTFSIYDALRSPSDKRSLRRLPALVVRSLRLVWQAARRELLLATALQLVAGVGVALQLLVGREVLGSILAADRVGQGFGAVAPGLVALAVINAVATFAAAAVLERQRILGELVGRYANDRIIEVAGAVELEAFESASFHDHLLRAQINAQARPLQLATGLLVLGSGAVSVAGIVVALGAIQPVFLPVMVLAYLPLWWAGTRNSQALYRFSFDLTPADRERTYLQRVLTGKDEAKEVRAFRLLGFLRRRYDQLYDLRLEKLTELTRRRMRRSLLASAASSLATVGAVVVLVALVLAERMSLADAGVAAVAVQQLGTRLRAVNAGAGSLYECTLFLEDFTSFLDLAPVAEAARPTGAAPEGFGQLRVDHVSFVYPGTRRPVLDDVSLDIAAGEIVALVGENGSGKTTLAKLLCGLYTPTAGRILWDGVDTAGCDPDALRRSIAVIFQDFVRYQLAARSNIAMGRHERFDDLDAIAAAARQSGAHEFLARLPHGYETLLSRAFEGGAELSIGQWQQVALARAFFCDAPFLVLDEPTAALDARAEHELFESIRTLARGRSVLLISHRFSSVRSADRIYVLEAGRVIEQGSHDQLLAGAGRYAELFRLQAAAYLDSAEPRSGPRG